MGQWRGEVASEQFDESTILLLFICVMEQFPIFRGIICSVLIAAGLVGAAVRAISVAMNSLVGAARRLR